MTAFRTLLSIVFLTVVVYTGLVIANHGPGLFPVFFGDIAALTWPGQFNLDFTCMLMFSALWVGYRHRYSPKGLLLSACALVGGSLFLSVYLLVVSFQAGGDMVTLLLGENRH